VSIEDLAEGPKLNIVSAPIDRIRPNPANPNELDPVKMETLKSDIALNGFTQPILVRPVEGDKDCDYELVDGEHRWLVLRELGASTVPAVVQEADDTEAALRMITMNRLRGDFIPIQLAHLLVRLSETISEAELKKRLGMTEPELRDTLQLADFSDKLADELREAQEREEREAPDIVTFVLQKKDSVLVERVLQSLLEEDSKADRAKALVTVFRAYESLNKLKETKS